MKVHCPKCNEPIPASKMNVETDVAVCPKCDEAFTLSDLMEETEERPDVPDEPPPGAWFRTDVDGWQVGATTRSLGALFLVPFTAVWAGGSMAGIYGSQLFKGEFNLVLSLFGIPFFLGSVCLVTLSLMMIVGTTSVTVIGNEGLVFTGIGRLGWRRRFQWDDVTKVEETATAYRNNNTTGMEVTLVGKTRLKFGSMWSDARRYFVLQILRRMRREPRK